MSGRPKPYILHVIDAICDSTLPPDLRHLLMVMAYKADNDTGRGLTGQARLAEAMGLAAKTPKDAAREIRRKLDRLEALPDAPVRVVRRKRGNPDGKRTSDEYTLELVKGTPTSSSEGGPGGRGRPLDETDILTAQGDVGATHGGRGRPHLGDVGVRGSTQGSTQMYLRSISVAPEGATAPARPPRKSTAKAERYTPEQKLAHQQLTEHYFAEFERQRGCKPVGWGAKEGRAVHELLGKLRYDVEAAKRIVTTGLASWQKATIMSIAGDPSACVGAAPREQQGQRAGDMLGRQLQRVRELEDAERRERALP